uniref:MADF domain-containing protein n=1 Tax=Plectus sambesii TaxID=2011161 RepID=A0A914WPQ5_9BILA
METHDKENLKTKVKGEQIMNDDQKDHLIALVQNNPALWDIRLKEYHNKDVKGNTWCRIAGELSKNILEGDTSKTPFTAGECEEQWRQIKNYFYKRLNIEAEDRRSGHGAVKRKKWRFWDAMQFARHQLNSQTARTTNVPRELLPTSSSQISSQENSGELSSSLASHSESSVIIDDDESERIVAPTPTVPTKKTKKEKDDKELEQLKASMNEMATAIQLGLGEPQREDQWEVYGQRLAAALRSMPALDRAKTIRDIDALVNEKNIEIAERVSYSQL